MVYESDLGGVYVESFQRLIMKFKIVLLTLVFVSGIISGCLGENVENNESELLWTGSSPTEYERNFDVGEYPIFAESGEAADIEVPTFSNKDIAIWISENLSYDQLILEFYNGVDPRSGWVHVSYVDEEKNRKQNLTINKNGTFPGFI